jgi:hypothetical protein
MDLPPSFDAFPPFPHHFPTKIPTILAPNKNNSPAFSMFSPGESQDFRSVKRGESLAEFHEYFIGLIHRLIPIYILHILYIYYIYILHIYYIYII